MKLDEKKLYQKNSLGYSLVLFFIILNTIYSILALNTMNVNFKIGIFIMVTIILSMIGFLSAVKVQIYSLFWSYISIGIGFFQFIRLLLMPQEIVGGLKIFLVIILILSICLIITGGITSVISSKKRIKYIKQHYGNKKFISK